MDIKQSNEQKGEYHEKVKKENENEKKPVGSAAVGGKGVESLEDTLGGGFAEGFHLSQTKHEIDINQKHANDLIESLRKNGIDLGKNGLNGIDLKSLFNIE